MTWTTLTAEDGHELAAWQAKPERTARGGVVVIQEIFGVNGHIRDVADRYAAEGYLAVAPAIFDRVKRGVELGYDADGIARGRELIGELDPEALVRDVAAAVRAAGEAGNVGIVGYCFGGAVVWVAAARIDGLACAASYYGSRIPQYLDLAPRVPVIMHVGREDASFPMDTVAEVTARHPGVVVHAYDAGHGFNCDRRGSYEPASAKLALERTLALFAEHVG